MYETAETTYLTAEKSHRGSRPAVGKLGSTYGNRGQADTHKQKEWKIAYYPEDGVTAEELMDKLTHACSIEARAGWEAEHLPYRRIGMIDRGARITVLYEDTEGNIWYETKFRTEDGTIISDTEYIFGRDVLKTKK